jgi:hypothetical protein
MADLGNLRDANRQAERLLGWLFGIGAEVDPGFVVAEVARRWPLDVGKAKLWRVRLHRVNAGTISAAVLGQRLG